MKVFIALTFYFEILHKQNLKSFWTKNEVYHTPFPYKVMKRDFFLNIFAFLLLCDNATYIKKGHGGYDPRKKVVFFYQSFTERLRELWWPRPNLSIDEGYVPFKRRTHFKFYNPSKIDKCRMKTFKLVDSSNNYCLKFDIYVGLQDDVSGFDISDISCYMDIYKSFAFYSWTISTPPLFCFIIWSWPLLEQ